MKTSNTAQRLKQLMSERHLRQVDIVNLCQPFCKNFNAKLQKNDLSQYLSGKVEPSQYKLTILGLALNVSESWLMGYDTPMNRGDHGNIYIEVSDLERDLVQTFRSISPDKQSLILNIIRAATQEGDKK